MDFFLLQFHVVLCNYLYTVVTPRLLYTCLCIILFDVWQL